MVRFDGQRIVRQKPPRAGFFDFMMPWNRSQTDRSDAHTLRNTAK